MLTWNACHQICRANISGGGHRTLSLFNITAYTQILLFIQYVVASRVYLCWLLILHVATFKELNKLIPLRIREDIFGNGGIATLTGKSKLSQIAGRCTGKLTMGARPSFVLSYRRAG